MAERSEGRDVGEEKAAAIRRFLWDGLLNDPHLRDDVIGPKFFSKTKVQQYEFMEMLLNRSCPRTYCPGCLFRKMNIPLDCPCGTVVTPVADAKSSFEKGRLLFEQSLVEKRKKIEENVRLARLRQKIEEDVRIARKQQEADAYTQREIIQFVDVGNDTIELSDAVLEYIAEIVNEPLEEMAEYHNCNTRISHYRALSLNDYIRDVVSCENDNLVIGNKEDECVCNTIHFHDASTGDDIDTKKVPTYGRYWTYLQSIASFDATKIVTIMNFKHSLENMPGIKYKKLSGEEFRYRYIIGQRCVTIDYRDLFGSYNKAGLMFQYYSKTYSRDDYVIVPFSPSILLFTLVLYMFYEIDTKNHNHPFERRKNPLKVPGLDIKALEINMEFGSAMRSLTSNLMIHAKNVKLLASKPTLDTLYYILYGCNLDVGQLDNLLSSFHMHGDDLRSRLIVGLSNYISVDDVVRNYFKNLMGRNASPTEDIDIVRKYLERVDLALKESLLRTHPKEGYHLVALHYSNKLLMKIKRNSRGCGHMNIFYNNFNEWKTSEVEIMKVYRLDNNQKLHLDLSMNGITLGLIEEDDVREIIMVVRIIDSFVNTIAKESFWALVSDQACSVRADVIKEYDDFFYGLSHCRVVGEEDLDYEDLESLVHFNFFLGLLKEYDIAHWKFRELMGRSLKQIDLLIAEGNAYNGKDEVV